jgi:hypothetical protein
MLASGGAKIVGFVGDFAFGLEADLPAGRLLLRED